MLEDALKANFSAYHRGDPDKMAAIEYEPRTSAIDEEHVVFKSSKLNTLYKATVMRKVNDIKRHTNCQQLHASLIPKFASQLTPVSQLLKGGLPPGFATVGQAVEQCQGTAETNDLIAVEQCQGTAETNDLRSDTNAETNDIRADTNAETNDLGSDTPHSSDDESSSAELDESDANAPPDCDNDRPETNSSVSRLFYNSTYTDYGDEQSDISLVLVPRAPPPKIKYFFEQDTDNTDTAPTRCFSFSCFCGGFSLKIRSHKSNTNRVDFFNLHLNYI